MRVTAETVAVANRRLAEIANDLSIGDGCARLAKMAEVWGPISDSADSMDIPGGRKGVLGRFGDDFVGVTHDGHMIVWGQPRPMPGTEVRWRELIILGPQR